MIKILKGNIFKFENLEKIKYLTLTDASKVWMPDTFFRNEKIGAFHNILTPNLYIRVFPDGDVLYSIRISLTCFCSMYLALFPLDEQTCNLDIASCKCLTISCYFNSSILTHVLNSMRGKL